MPCSITYMYSISVILKALGLGSHEECRLPLRVIELMQYSKRNPKPASLRQFVIVLWFGFCSLKAIVTNLSKMNLSKMNSSFQNPVIENSKISNLIFHSTYLNWHIKFGWCQIHLFFSLYDNVFLFLFLLFFILMRKRFHTVASTDNLINEWF